MNPLRPRLPWWRSAAVWLLAGVAGCATPTAPPAPIVAQLQRTPPPALLILGEQHDAPEHPQLQRQVVQWLAERDRLAALALEMLPRGRSSAGLPPPASEATVRAALDWPESSWPWSRYGPVVMAALRAGVPVLGANLPRSEQGAALRDASLDTRLPPAAWQALQQRIRRGHCDVLPEPQIVPMTRVQVARDRAMAATLQAARVPGRSVLLVAGNQHADRRLGVPAQLPDAAELQVIQVLPAGADDASADAAGADAAALGPNDLRWRTAPLAPHDHCAAWRTAPPAAQ